jgi:hypothetical protein
MLAPSMRKHWTNLARLVSGLRAMVLFFETELSALNAHPWLLHKNGSI